MSHLLLRRRILLMMLLLAAPLRSAPFGRSQVAMAKTATKTSRDRQIPAEWQRPWEWDPDWDSAGSQQAPPTATTAREFDDLSPDDNGYPVPKSNSPDMGNNELSSDYFPPYPELFGRQWHLQHLKQLQVQHKWQSPPSTFSIKPKRAPIQWPPQGDNEEQLVPAGEPRYPFAYTLPWKRKHLSQQKQPKLRYMPSISAGAMTNLGDFFNQLEANVRFAEQSQLGESETRLLKGKHPYPLVPSLVSGEETDDGDPLQQQQQQEEQDRKTTKLLRALHSYRPSQKIRSLVSRNPQGYRGSQFIDPSYMWLGLGK
ncbi:hypothetical protein KR018_011304 [Drosophila ironensis]|nr:hypothetical protein KR018_011304 [Drosophila ironensis]